MIKTSTIVVLVFLLCICGLFVAAKRVAEPVPVSYRLKDDIEVSSNFHQKLNYLPWSDLTATNSWNNEVRLLPGMRLRLLYAQILPEKRNVIASPPVQFEWIVPSENGPFDSRDIFWLSYLVSLGLPPSTEQTSATNGGLFWLNDLHASENENSGFYQLFAKKKLAPVLKTLRLSVRSDAPLSAENFSADRLRIWFTQPGYKDYTNDGTAQRWLNVDASMSDTKPPVTLELFGRGNTLFFNNQSQMSESTDEYHQRNYLFQEVTSSARTIYNPRVLLEADIPVRVQSDLRPDTRSDFESHYYPFYWTVDNLQARLGVRIDALRRRGTFLPDVLRAHIARAHTTSGDQPIPERLNPQALVNKNPQNIPNNSYFTIWFKSNDNVMPGETFGANDILEASEEQKKRLLLAPGDIVYCTRRLSQTDAPEVR